MSPGGHLVTTVLACAAAYVATGSAELAAGVAAGGFLIDLDHVFDYLVVERQRDLRPAAFLRYYLEGRCRRVVLPLHSYELFAFLLLTAWLSHQEWLWGYVLGVALHLPLDIIFNGRFVPGGLIRFYSFTCRARARFLAERFANASRLAPLEDSFWVSFFRGARLAQAPEERMSPPPPSLPHRLPVGIPGGMVGDGTDM